MMKFIRIITQDLRFFMIFFLLFFIGSAVLAQVRITGKVSGPGGAGVPGISATIGKTSLGTATDQDGNFAITGELKPGTYKLSFSGVGFKSTENTVTIGSANAYTSNATLQGDALGLDEVVVTGTPAGTTRRQLGNFISSVKAEQLTKGGAGNVLSALQGKTAGAQISQNSGDPAGGMSVRLRGISSLSSSSEPLYIVDGVIVNNATNRVTNTQSGYDGGNFIGNVGQNRMVDINPADIERIEVLNGAAAAAIYGSRANAGVVQIFTKKGTQGTPVVNFSTAITSSSVRKRLDVNQSPVKFGGSPDVFTQDIISTTGTPAALPTNTTNVSRYDYQDYIFQNGLGTDNNVSVSGGTENTKYYLSASYFFNQGIIKNTDFRRYSFRANVEQTISKILSVNLGMNYVNSGGNEKPDGNSFYSPMNSVTILGNFHDIQTKDALGNVRVVGERGRVNPVSVIEDFKQRQETNRVIANFGAKLKPFKGLSLDYTLGIDNYNQNGSTYMPAFAYNVSTAFWGGGPTLDPTLNGYSSTGNNVFFQINHEINANYQVDFSPSVSSSTQVGYSAQYEKNRYSLLQGRGMPALVETVTGASTQLPSVDDRSEFSVSGVYAQESLKFWNRLFLTGAIRIDGSSVFGKDQRNNVYPKASGSFLVSESEGWRSKLPWWNLLKLRAAYGESGNLTGISAYGRINQYFPTSYLGRIALNGASRLANEDVKPERQKELEIGTDMSFFNDRLGVQFNYYNKKIQDLLLDRLIAPTNGYSSLQDNFGSMENRGFEVVLTGSPVRNENFQWNVTGIYNHNRNKAVRVGQALTLFSTNAGAPVSILEGLPIGGFYGTFFAVDASGNQIKNAAGLPQIEKGIQNSPLSYTTQRDANGLPAGTTLRKIIGDPNPDYTASLVNEITFKKFDLRVQFDAVQGNEVFNADFRTRQGVGNGKIAEQEQTGQLPRGWINSVYQIEQWRVNDGSFVKLREASLGYRFGKVGGFNDLSLRLAGRNLISWDNYNGYDPEMNSAGQSTILRGIDFGTVPIPRSFSFTIGAKF